MRIEQAEPRRWHRWAQRGAAAARAAFRGLTMVVALPLFALTIEVVHRLAPGFLPGLFGTENRRLGMAFALWFLSGRF